MATRGDRVVPPALDPSRGVCPLCGDDNRCRAGAADCWCMTLEIPARVLDRVPEAERDRACICARCARGDY